MTNAHTALGMGISRGSSCARGMQACAQRPNSRAAEGLPGQCLILKGKGGAAHTPAGEQPRLRAPMRSDPAEGAGSREAVGPSGTVTHSRKDGDCRRGDPEHQAYLPREHTEAPQVSSSDFQGDEMSFRWVGPSEVIQTEPRGSWGRRTHERPQQDRQDRKLSSNPLPGRLFSPMRKPVTARSGPTISTGEPRS